MDTEADTNSGSETNTNTEKTFTQEEVNNMMSTQKTNITRKLKSKYEDLGSFEELQSLKVEHDDRKQQEQIDKGEFETTLKELASRKDEQIAKRDAIISGYKVNTPIIDAASQMNAVSPQQVKDLLQNKVKLNDEGDVEVLDKGKVRYKDDGTKFGVTDLVTEFLNDNPHFVRPTKSTTHTKSNADSTDVEDFDFSTMDMKNPKHRAKYAKYRKAQGLNNA